MGQRHQVWVRTKDRYNEERQIIGIHHQWMFGQTAIILLRNLIKFHQKNLNAPFGTPEVFQSGYDEQDALVAVYSADPVIGYYHRVTPLSEFGEINTPQWYDNNDGITIIDLSLKKPKYCLMAINGLECDHSQEYKVQNFVPLSAQEYLSLYYPNYLEDRKEFAIALKAIKDLSKYTVLSPQEVRDIFPELPAKEPEPIPRSTDAVLGGGDKNQPEPGSAVLGRQR